MGATTERIEERMSSPGVRLAMQFAGIAFAALLTALVTLTFLKQSEAGTDAENALNRSSDNKQAIALLQQQTQMMAQSQKRMSNTQSTNIKILQSTIMQIQHISDTQEHIAKTQERILQSQRP